MTRKKFSFPRPITRLIRSLMLKDRGSQTRVAELLNIDRTTVAHWVSEDSERDYCVPADALAVICDALDTIAPLQAIADELGYDVVPKSRPTPSPQPISTGTLEMLGHLSRLGLEVEERSKDGTICDNDARVIVTHLDALIATAQATKARLPRGANA